MLDAAKSYLVTLGVFLVLDALWLGLAARRFYQEQLGALLAKEPNWAAAGAFYLLFAAGLVFFVVVPGAREGSPGSAAWRGAFFGLVAYAAYDLTNLATLARWSTLLSMVDLAWGASASAATSFLSVWILRARG